MAASYQTSYQVNAYLKFLGDPLVMSMNVNKDEQVFSIKVSDFSIGKLMTGIVQMVRPGYQLSLSTPWSYILNFEISEVDLLLKVPKNSGDASEFGISFDPRFNDFGFEISKIEVFARSVREVNVNMEGQLSIFGLQYPLAELFGQDGVNLLGAEGLPQPAPKPGLLELNFLGVGQHLQLTNAASYNHVDEVVDDMLRLFNPPPPGAVVPVFPSEIQFSNESQWLVGLDMELMNTVALQIVFNDPVLYGLFIKLSGEKAKVLAGLEFEVLYKKVTDDIGVYQLELKLPDSIRNMEFGEVSITLPVIALWIYTNGNFKVDLGFPYNNDFTNSFTVQMFPFFGQGGFYFAYLSGATSTAVPISNNGTFDPVLAFGLGMNVGLGKTFNKGILSAGLTITFYGMLEGVLAWFNPYEGVNVDTSLTDFFYSLKGTFGVIGHIYGTVNFAIISARLDIVVYAQISVDMEAVQPIYLAFEAGVSLQLTVKINLGLFKVSIHLSFSATIKESFTIGSSSQAQWNALPQAQLMATSLYRLTSSSTPPDPGQPQVVPLHWDNTFSQYSVQPLTVQVVPLWSVKNEGSRQQAVGIVSLFLENNRGLETSKLEAMTIDRDSLSQSGNFTAFDKLCISVLGWMLNALFTEQDKATTFDELLEMDITNVDITNILYSLDQLDFQNNDSQLVELFSYDQVVNFIRELFQLNLVDPNIEIKSGTNQEAPQISEEDKQDLYLTVFPMIPQLFLANSADQTVIDFSRFNEVNDGYVSRVQELIRQFTDMEQGTAESIGSSAGPLMSMSNLIFRDFFLLIGKSLLQEASDIMESFTYQLASDGSESLSAIAQKFNTSVGAIIKSNKVQNGLLQPQNLINVSGVAYTCQDNETFEKIQNLHHYTSSGEAWQLTFVQANFRVRMFVPMGQLIVDPNDINTKYRILPGDTFETILENNNISIDDSPLLVQLNLTNDQILQPLTSISLPPFESEIASEATFLSIANQYAISLDDLAEVNQVNTQMLTPSASLVIESVSQLSIADLMNAVFQKDYFRGTGGSATRFTLNGTRLPVVSSDGSAGNEYNGLYGLTGQQFTLPTITDPASFSYTFTLSKTAGPDGDVDPLPWVLFNGLEYAGDGLDHHLTTLDYQLIKDEIDLLTQYQQLSLQPTIEEGPSVIQLYRDQQKAFAFNNPIVWQSVNEPVGNLKIWNFPRSLSAVIAQTPDVKLNIAVQPQANSQRTITALSTTNDYEYTTLVPLSIKRLKDVSGGETDQKTFEVFGTDASGIELLTELLKSEYFDSLVNDLTILYATDSANSEARELRSVATEGLLLLLINTNLSTETNPGRALQALNDPKISNTPFTTFIQRIWKASLVKTGGYYLYYSINENGDSLPESLFSANGDAEIYMLIKYNPAAILATSASTIQPFMNSAITQVGIDLSQQHLFGLWDVALDDGNEGHLVMEGKIDRTNILKPGNIGFQLTRENPNKKYGDSSGVVTGPNYPYDLEIQYNLLDYKVEAGQQINPLNSIIPAGPIGNQQANEPENDDSMAPWQYSKAVPVADFYQGASILPDPLSIPLPASASPYIGLNDTVNIGFDWQDNYGNTYDCEIPQLPVQIKYTDKIVPVTAWPCTNLTYFFSPPDQGSSKNFQLTVSFQPGDNYGWDSGGEKAGQAMEAVIKRAQYDLKQWVTIYYQIAQDDLEVTFNVSLSPDRSFPETVEKQVLLKNDIKDYIDHALQWTINFLVDPDAHNQYRAPGNSTLQYSFATYSNNAIAATNTQDIFPLTTKVTLSRNGDYIDEQFVLQQSPKAYAPGVQSATSAAKPKLVDPSSYAAEPNDDQDNLLALAGFAEYFESAFGTSQLKLTATFVNGQETTLTSTKEEELWIVRFKTLASGLTGIGYQIQFDQSNFYAPQPLANFLVSLNKIPIYNFDHYNNGAPVIVEKSFNSIDPEVWAMGFLETLEATFQPAFSLPITMVDHLNGHTQNNGVLAGLLAAKEMLAQAIALQTIPILQSNTVDAGGWKVAREKLQQQLLIDLASGYKMDAIIQYNTSVESPYPNNAQAIAPNLYGQPFVAATYDNGTDTNQNYKLSTAKVPLANLSEDDPQAGTSYLTCTFSTTDPTLESNIPLPIHYQVNHMEFDIQHPDVPTIDQNEEPQTGFELSKWLTFIKPVEANDSDVISNIPVPIRQYPALPVFDTQTFSSHTTYSSGNVSIEGAKHSDFVFGYDIGSFTAQNSYSMEVYFNARNEDWDLLSTSEGVSEKQGALFSKLAQFDFVSEQFINAFKELFPQVNPSISTTGLAQITTLLNSYEGLVSDVAQAWSNLYNPDLEILETSSIDVVKALFTLNEKGADDTSQDSLFEIEISQWSFQANSVDINYVTFPIVSLDQYTTQVFVSKSKNGPITPLPEGADPSGYHRVLFRFYTLDEDMDRVYLSFNKGTLITNRTVTFENLSILQIQNGWAGLKVERNELLSGQYQTSPEFIYTTPVRRFANPVTPSVKISESIPIGVSYGSTDLVDYLMELFSTLMGMPDGSITPVNLKILVNYNYSITGESIQLPVLLMPPTIFDHSDIAGSGVGIQALNQKILDWFHENSPYLQNGVLSFAVTFFSSLNEDSTLPLLILEKVTLPVAIVSNISGETT